jgi:hypothetical protein
MTNEKDWIRRGDAMKALDWGDIYGRNAQDAIAALPAAPMGAWKDIADYDEDRDQLVQVLCRVLPDIAGDFPRSSDFPISSGDHAVGDVFVSIGFCNDDGHWAVAGWDMTQDCFTDASLYEVLAWQPLAPAALTQPPAPTLRDALELPEVQALKAALHRISLGSQDSGTTKESLGREARAALAALKGGAK